jgi:hypothetical protein
MTKQTRHHAGRTQSADPNAGLPAPGQALVGYPEPPSSLFGVPLQSTSLFGVPQQVPRDGSIPDGVVLGGAGLGEAVRGGAVREGAGRAETSASWAPAPPRPRTPQDDYLRTRPQLPAVPGRARRRRQWPQLLGFPLAVLVLGVALGVIAVVMLLAAGVPAPWAATSGPAPTGPSTMPAQSTSGQSTSGQSTSGQSTSGQSTRPGVPAPDPRPVATKITKDGTYRVGDQVRAGRYRSEGGVSCYWARLQNVAGVSTVVAEGNGAGRTTVWIRNPDTAFRTSGCLTWTRR